MDVDTTIPNPRDEEGPWSLSLIVEIQGTTEATTTLLPSSGGLEDNSFIAKTSYVTTADEGFEPDAGSPQYQEKRAHDITSLDLGHATSDFIRVSDDSISLDDDSNQNVELTAAVEGPESEVSKLKEFGHQKASG